MEGNYVIVILYIAIVLSRDKQNLLLLHAVTASRLYISHASGR